MVSFRDVKAFFHNIADAFNSIGLLVNSLPWPLSELRAPFYTLRDWFEGADWIWDGVQLWLLTIEQTALGAKYWTDQALTQASQAWDWISTTGNTLSAQVTYTLNLATNAWAWIVDTGYALAAQAVDFAAAIEALRSELLSWIASQLYGIRNELLSEMALVRATLEAADVDLDTRLKELGLRTEPVTLWDALGPGLVDKLIEELDKRW